MGSLVRVLVAATGLEGLLARSRLEAEGIPVLAKGEAEGPYRVGPLELWVAEEHEVQARLVLAEIAAGATALEDDPADGG